LIIGSSLINAQPPNLKVKVDSLIGTTINDTTPGCVLGVLKDGKVLYKQHYGMANLDFRIPVTDSTVFNLESVSKQFTAFLILLLEKDGKLNLDDSVQKYIPELKSYGSHITIRQLLHHTSGIPSSDVINLFAGYPEEAPWDSEDLFNLLHNYHRLNFKPNDEFLYSNSGYYILSRIIEKVEGKSYSKCLQERIFSPLSMNTASVNDSSGKIILNRASGYKTAGKYFARTNSESDSNVGYSNIYLSANDFINWSVNMSTRSIGGKTVFEKIFNPVDTLNSGERIGYTYGFFTWNPNGPKFICHEGGGPGFRAYFAYYPYADFSFFIMSNNEKTDVMQIESTVTQWFLKDSTKTELKKEHKENKINKELFQHYTGSYVHPKGLILRFENENDTLKLIIPDNPKFVLYPESENEFFLKDFDAQCTFVKDNTGKVNEIIWHQGSENSKCTRFTETKLFTKMEMQSFTGNYRIPGLDIPYPVYLKDNDLYIALPKTFRQVGFNTEMKITHMSGDKFLSRLGLIEFKRDKKNKIASFVVADVGRMRNIEFTKQNQAVSR
jgi:CubicO group peptidase (beta-lactamase class C family)